MRVDPKLISEGLLDSEAATLQQRCRRVVDTSSANVISLEHAMLNHFLPLKDSRSNAAYPRCISRWRQILARILRSFRCFPERRVFAFIPQPSDTPRLDRGWIIANHKLVSFHAAFLTSLLSIPLHVASRFDVHAADVSER